MITKLLVANRGEIARRVFRTCRLMGIRTVAVHADPDRSAPFVTEADEAYGLGAGTASETYLQASRLIEAATITGADAVHPGYGFLAEDASFARAVMEAGLTWVGPSPEAIEAMGSKLEAKRLMTAAGVDVLPSIDLTGLAPGEVDEAAARCGFPLLVKASAGGGGKGMQVVSVAQDVASAVEAGRRQAEAAFGDGTVFLEPYLPRPRHIEVQVFGDSQGTVVPIFERECSIQRRHQKIVEEAPAPRLAPATKAGLTTAAVRGARAIGYVNAGTMEFLVDAAGHFYFLEMNTRLQVEHPVTEETTGTDIVVEQLRVAAGEPLAWAQEQIVQRGAAIECRVYAEDPARGFLPSPGTITRLVLPQGEGLRVESGVKEGSVVSVHYDPLLFKLVARGDSREQAIERMAGALGATVVEGVRTTIPFVLTVLGHPDFRSGTVHTQMVEQGAFNG